MGKRRSALVMAGGRRFAPCQPLARVGRGKAGVVQEKFDPGRDEDGLGVARRRVTRDCRGEMRGRIKMPPLAVEMKTGQRPTRRCLLRTRYADAGCLLRPGGGGGRLGMVWMAYRRAPKRSCRGRSADSSGPGGAVVVMRRARRTMTGQDGPVSWRRRGTKLVGEGGEGARLAAGTSLGGGKAPLSTTGRTHCRESQFHYQGHAWTPGHMPSP